MLATLRPILGGLTTLIPGGRRVSSGGGLPTRYFYSTWLRHLTVMASHGIAPPRGTVVELGPGDSLGVCMAALLSGAARAVALDRVCGATPPRDLEVLGELVALFRARAPIPGGDEFPLLRPHVESLDFPAVLDDATLARGLAPERVADIAAARRDGLTGPDSPLTYRCPWDAGSVEPGSADVVCSQAVLEYLTHEPGADELTPAFAAMHAWLRPGGVMSHQVDFSSPFGAEWNAHWGVSDLTWRVVRARRTHYENRVPLSTYLTLCRTTGFEVLGVIADPATAGVPRSRVARRFRDLPDEDHRVRSAYLLARKR